MKKERKEIKTKTSVNERINKRHILEKQESSNRKTKKKK